MYKTAEEFDRAWHAYLYARRIRAILRRIKRRRQH